MRCSATSSRSAALLLPKVARLGDLGPGLAEAALLDAGLLDPVLGRERHRAGVVSQGTGQREDRVGLRGAEDLVPEAEPHADLQRHDQVAVGDRRVRPRPLRRDQGHHLVDGLDGCPALASHHGGIGKHVIIMGDVEAVEARVGPDGQEAAVGRDGLAVGLRRLVQWPSRTSMCEGMWTLCESPGWRSRSRSAAASARSGRVEGSTAWMYRWLAIGCVGVERQHLFDQGDDRLGPRLGLAVLGVEVPGAEVHQRLGEQGADVGVVRVLRPEGDASRRHRPGRARERSSGGSGTQRRARASMRPRSSSLARRSPARACAEGLDGDAGLARRRRSGRLMCGPWAMATPHQAIAQSGSSSAACRNERAASSWLKAKRKFSP